LQVGHHGHQMTFLLRDLSQGSDRLSVSGMVAMRKVDSRHVHPGPNQAAYYVRRTGSWSNRADNLGTRHLTPERTQISRQQRILTNV
jgi:hypothetical protein